MHIANLVLVHALLAVSASLVSDPTHCLLSLQSENALQGLEIPSSSFRIPARSLCLL